MKTKFHFTMMLDAIDDDISLGNLIESDHRLLRHLMGICGIKRFTFMPEGQIAKKIKVNSKSISHSKVTKGVARLRSAGHISTRKTNGNNRIDLKTYIESKSTYYLRGKKIINAS